MQATRTGQMKSHIRQPCQSNGLHSRRTSYTPWRKLGPKVFATKGTGEGASEESMESLFMKELERRSSASGKRPGNPFQTATSTTEEAGKRSTPREPDPRETKPKLEREQLSVSRGLSSEGLEGLIPRAKELLKLGGSFWLGFLPLILAVSIMFSALYLGFGENFIHGGSTKSRPPPYVDPYDLLSEPTVDPTIPFYER